MRLGIEFWKDFGGSWEENGGMLAPKINETTIPTLKSDFVKTPGFTEARIDFFKILEVEVGSKIDQKSIKK